MKKESLRGFNKELLSPPLLPNNINENRVFQAVPDLFTGDVDDSQNHINETCFFSQLAEANLTFDQQYFNLEEVDSDSQRRISVKVINFKLMPVSDELMITTEDNREHKLRIRTYRAENFPRDGSDMTDLDRISIFASTNDTGKYLFFYIKLDNT